MKKSFSKFMMLLTILAMVLAISPIESQAATTAVMKKANAVTKSLTSYSNYRGWEVTSRVRKQTAKQVIKNLRIETATGTYFAFRQVTKKSGKKYSTYFTSGGKKLTLKDVKRSIARYSSAKTARTFLKARSKKAAATLATYSKQYGWAAKVSTTGTTKKATSTIVFDNASYQLTAQVIVTRNAKAPKKSFTLQGTASTTAVIKSWLRQYQVSTPNTPAPETTATTEPSTEPTTDPTTEPTTEPSTEPTTDPTDSATIESLTPMVTIYANDLVAVGKEYGWTATITGAGTSDISIAFENSAWEFVAGVYAADIDGKAQIVYRLVDVVSNRETIVEWLTKTYYVAPTDPTNSPTAEETAAPSASPSTPVASNEPQTPTKTITDADLRAAAIVYTNELLIEAVKYNWSYTEVLNTGTKIQNLFENSKWNFKVMVEAKAVDGEIQIVYTLTAASETIVDKETVLEWFTTYQAAPKAQASTTTNDTANNSPTASSPTPSPTTNPDTSSTSTPSPSPTTSSDSGTTATTTPTPQPTTVAGPTSIGGGGNTSDSDGDGDFQPAS